MKMSHPLGKDATNQNKVRNALLDEAVSLPMYYLRILRGPCHFGKFSFENARKELST